jgi:hypothetical protein
MLEALDELQPAPPAPAPGPAEPELPTANHWVSFQQLRACQDAYNELYARNVRLYDELTAAHEVIERLQRADVPGVQQR